jgi:glycosyltransferase 2 family protein
MRKTLLTLLQILVTLGLLWFVFRDPTKRTEMLATVRGADLRWLLAGLAIYGVVEFLAGVRWVILLRVQGVTLGIGRTFALLTHGQHAGALLSVLMDRILGLIGLILLAGLIVAWRWDWLTSTPTTAQGVWTTLFILGSAVSGIAFSFIVTGFGLVHLLPARLPGRDRLAELALAYNLYGHAWRHSLAGLFLSIAIHVGYFGVFYCAAEAFRSDGVVIPSLGDLIAVMPVVNTIAAMPISLGGIGIREGLFQIFLGQLCGVSEAVAVLVSSTGYLLTLVWGIGGGLIYLLYRPSEHARLRDIRAAVAKAEHTIAEEEIASETGGEKKP